MYQSGEIYDIWKVSRESESHSAPAGGVSAYALPFLAKMAMLVDRSDKSIDICLVWRHIPRTNSLTFRFHKLPAWPYRPAASLNVISLAPEQLGSPPRVPESHRRADADLTFRGSVRNLLSKRAVTFRPAETGREPSDRLGQLGSKTKGCPFETQTGRGWRV